MTATAADALTNWFRATAVWDEYKQAHDVGPYSGKLVGVDAGSGAVYFADTADELEQQRGSATRAVPLWVTRVVPPGVKRHRSMRPVSKATETPRE